MNYSELIYGLIFISAIVFGSNWFMKKKKSVNKAYSPPIQSAGSNVIILQAYERMVTFCERISFSSIIQRMNSDILNARELAEIYKETIRNEYDFNISQQLYVSETTWQAIADLKDQQIFIISQILGSLPNEADNKMLNNALLTFLKMDENASMQPIVLKRLRMEAKNIIH